MKAVLVIDMPSNCSDCPCEYDYLICKAIYHKLDYVDADNERPSWCPLRPLPKYRDNSKKPQDNAEVWIDGALTGWNACLDEITGETECTTQKKDT